MNNSILIILALCLFGSIIGIIIHFSYKIKSKYQKQKLSVAILVISISKSKDSANQRWQIEKNNWLHVYKYPTWADVFLLECSNIKENFIRISKHQCTESFDTGIFQKTILAIEKLLPHKYNYYIRTNLSTFIIYNKLYKYLNKIGIVNEPIYRGVYCTSFVGGFGIILNKVAAKKLVEIGKQAKYFNKKDCDDVLIGRIMKSIDCACKKKEILYYQWNYQKSESNNIHAIQKGNHNIFIRLKTANSKIYSRVINTLVNKLN